MGSSVDTAREWVELVFAAFGPESSVAHGAFHEVLIAQDRVARVLLGGDQMARAGREHANHAALPERIGDVHVPAVQSRVVTGAGFTGYLLTAVPGKSRDVTWADAREPLTEVLDALHRTPAPQGLAHPRAWCGGTQLAEIVESQFGDQLGQAHPDAVRLVRALDTLTSPRTVFVHGDFGPHNLLWQGSRVSGLIDFDHATAGDPAMDVAPLIGLFGARAVAEITERDTLERALWHRATLSLQVAAAAHTCDLLTLRDHALGNFRRRWAEGTLFDPEGTHPQ